MSLSHLILVRSRAAEFVPPREVIELPFGYDLTATTFSMVAAAGVVRAATLTTAVMCQQGTKSCLVYNDI